MCQPIKTETKYRGNGPWQETQQTGFDKYRRRAGALMSGIIGDRQLEDITTCDETSQLQHRRVIRASHNALTNRHTIQYTHYLGHLQSTQQVTFT